MPVANFSTRQFPFTKPPSPGQVVDVVPGARWFRLPPPYRLDHVNINLIEGTDGWTMLDTTRLAAKAWRRQNGAMSIDGLSDEMIRAILTGTRRIAVVGASDKSWRPSHGVFGFLLSRGYDATPVNPMLAGRAIHGRTVVASLVEAMPLEMVDIFRASANAGAAVDEAIRLHAQVIWMQLGVVDEAAAERARAAGITVVMDRCPVIEERRLGLARH